MWMMEVHILGLKMAFSLNINMISLLTYPAGTLHGVFEVDEMIFHFANDESKTCVSLIFARKRER